MSFCPADAAIIAFAVDPAYDPTNIIVAIAATTIIIAAMIIALDATNSSSLT